MIYTDNSEVHHTLKITPVYILEKALYKIGKAFYLTAKEMSMMI